MVRNKLCKLKTTNAEFAKKLFFDIPEFKKAEARHDFNILDIEVPKDEKDPVKMREKAIRKGKIIRKLTVNDSESQKEYVFSA